MLTFIWIWCNTFTVIHLITLGTIFIGYWTCTDWYFKIQSYTKNKWFDIGFIMVTFHLVSLLVGIVLAAAAYSVNNSNPYLTFGLVNGALLNIVMFSVLFSFFMIYICDSFKKSRQFFANKRNRKI